MSFHISDEFNSDHWILHPHSWYDRTPVELPWPFITSCHEKTSRKFYIHLRVRWPFSSQCLNTRQTKAIPWFAVQQNVFFFFTGRQIETALDLALRKLLYLHSFNNLPPKLLTLFQNGLFLEWGFLYQKNNSNKNRTDSPGVHLNALQPYSTIDTTSISFTRIDVV